MPKLLTIAIPVYNTEKYLDECLSSVLTEQTSPFVEVLLINDGSVDASASLIDSYAQRFPEIIRAIHKENGGWGACINWAILEARGRYFKILDSDDLLAEGSLEHMLEFLKSQNADLVVTELTEHYPLGRTASRACVVEHEGFLLYDEYLSRGGLLLPMGCICCRTALLRDNNVKLPERYYADVDYGIKIHTYSRSIYISSLNVYQYRKDVDGQSTSLAAYAKNKSNYMDLIRSEISFYLSEKASMSPAVRKVFLADLKGQMKFLYTLYLSPKFSIDSDEIILKQFDNELNELSKEVYRLSATSTTRKVIPFVWLWRKFGMNVFNMLRR